MRGSPMPLRRAAAVRRQRLSIIQFSTPKPPLRHPEPYRSILRGVRKLGHALALGGELHNSEGSIGTFSLCRVPDGQVRFGEKVPTRVMKNIRYSGTIHCPTR
jgi:putative hemolysin